MTRALHLTRRFFTSLWPGRPAARDEAWVAGILGLEELALWSRMANHDRRHSIAVTRRVEETLEGSPYAGDPRWLEASLLHDVGKVDAHLGVFGRVGATIAGAVAGRDKAPAWATRDGITRRVGLYLQHPALGAVEIRAAGGTEAAARWAAAHHDPRTWDDTGIPAPVVAALHDADDD
jgi:hypothetical protein